MKTRAVVIVVLLMLATLAAGVVLERNVFRLHSVVVTGCQKRDPNEVVAMTGLQYGQSMFSLDMDGVTTAVETNPYFRVEKVKRMFPDGLLIQVHERQTQAVIYYMGAIICMDETGMILEVRQTLGDLQCPLITGFRLSTYQVGQTVQSTVPEQVEVMEDLLEELIRQDAEAILSEINLNDLGNISMVTAEGYRVEFGDTTNMEKKIQWLRAIVPTIVQEGYGAGTIQVAAGNSASFLPDGVQSYVPPGSAVQDEPDLPDEPLPGDEPTLPEE